MGNRYHTHSPYHHAHHSSRAWIFKLLFIAVAVAIAALWIREAGNLERDDSTPQTTPKAFPKPSATGAAALAIGHVAERWEKCSGEGEACRCPFRVRFGAGDQWIVRHMCQQKMITCDSDAFGSDPKPNFAKACECLRSAASGVDPECVKSCFDEESGCTKEMCATSKLRCRKTCGLCEGEANIDKRSIAVQINLMRREPPVDPEAWRRKVKVEHGELYPNQAEEACKPIFDPAERLLAKAKRSPPQRTPTLLCLVYTLSTKAEAHRAIRETYGSQCDGLLLMSNVTDQETQQLKVHHEGTESYYNMWQKVRSIWGYVADVEEERQRFDWFVVGGDDLYVNVNNLKAYLGSEEIREASKNGEQAMYLGRRFRLGGGSTIFNSGGAGYVLNRAAVKLLRSRLDLPQCQPHHTDFSEDRLVAHCLSGAKVFPYDTKDAKKEERFMPFTPDRHFLFQAKHVPPSDWYIKYSIDLKFGMESMSEEVVSFHYLHPKFLRRVHALLNFCNNTKNHDGWKWKTCAQENEECKCPQGKVRYGSVLCPDGSHCDRFKYKEKYTGPCNNAAFGGDPAPNSIKLCECKED